MRVSIKGGNFVNFGVISMRRKVSILRLVGESVDFCCISYGVLVFRLLFTLDNLRLLLFRLLLRDVVD